MRRPAGRPGTRRTDAACLAPDHSLSSDFIIRSRTRVALPNARCGSIKTQPGAFGLSGTGLTVGRAERAIVPDSPGPRPWRFTGGTLKFVAVDVSGEAYVDLEREAEAMLMRE